MLAAPLKEPAIGNFFSGCWPNYQTNYSSLNYFGGLVLSGVGFGSYSGALLGLRKVISLDFIKTEFRSQTALVINSDY
jgi:hypothetical protein